MLSGRHLGFEAVRPIATTVVVSSPLRRCWWAGPGLIPMRTNWRPPEASTRITDYIWTFRSTVSCWSIDMSPLSFDEHMPVTVSISHCARIAYCGIRPQKTPFHSRMEAACTSGPLKGIKTLASFSRLFLHERHTQNYVLPEIGVEAPDVTHPTPWCSATTPYCLLCTGGRDLLYIGPPSLMSELRSTRRVVGLWRKETRR